MSEDFGDLESRLREAHAYEPRPALQAEIRGRLRPAGRQLPWAAFSAAAAVLVAVGGVGYFLSHAPRGELAGGSAARGSTIATAAAFGKLPRVPELRGASAAGAAASAGSSQAGPAQPTSISASEDAGLAPPYLPRAGLVYRWKLPPRPAGECPPPAQLNGYPVLGGSGPCGQPVESAPYRLAAAPAGAELVYVGVSDGTFGYFEPAFRLPGGSIVSALTPDELRG